jgi:hypothetical protein
MRRHSALPVGLRWGASPAAHAAVFSKALFSEREDIAHGALGEMFPVNAQ